MLSRHEGTWERQWEVIARVKSRIPVVRRCPLAIRWDVRLDIE
jgi:hypothetical protein